MTEIPFHTGQKLRCINGAINEEQRLKFGLMENGIYTVTRMKIGMGGNPMVKVSESPKWFDSWRFEPEEAQAEREAEAMLMPPPTEAQINKMAERLRTIHGKMS